MLLSIINKIYDGNLPFSLVLEIFYYLKNDNLLEDIKNYNIVCDFLFDKKPKLSVLKSFPRNFFHSPNILTTNPFVMKPYNIQNIYMIIKNYIELGFDETNQQRNKFNILSYLKRLYKYKNIDYEDKVKKTKYYLHYKKNKNLFNLRVLIGILNCEERNFLIKILGTLSDDAWEFSKNQYLKNCIESIELIN